MLSPGLRERDLQPEIMDGDDLDADRFVGSLVGLRRVNVFSRSAAILWPHVLELARGLGREVRLLDIATGAGDVPIALARRAKRAGAALQVHACDANPLALDFAHAQAERAGVDLECFPLRIGEDAIPEGFDVITSSLFLHHLPTPDAETFLASAAEASRHLLLVNDLRRTQAGFALAYWGVRLITLNDVCHHDGPQSVRSAFTMDEVTALAARAGLAEASVTPHWPIRYLLRWERS